MPESSYWYVGVAPVSVPYWDGVVMFEMKAEDLHVAAPMLFTTREKAEEELHTIREEMADAYLRAIGEYGETDINDALDNTPKLGLFEIEPWLPGEHEELGEGFLAMPWVGRMLGRD